MENDRPNQKSAEELEKRKLVLQQRIASHVANNPPQQNSVEQSKDRDLNARLKAESMSEKRKSAAISNDTSETSEDSSRGEDPRTGQSTDINVQSSSKKPKNSNE